MISHMPLPASLLNCMSGVANDSLASPPAAAGYRPMYGSPALLCGSVAMSFNDNS